MGSVSIFIFLLLTLISQCYSLPSKKTYIVHMKNHYNPTIYPTHQNWYSSTLQSLSLSTDSSNLDSDDVEDETDSDPLLYSYTTAYTGFAAKLNTQQADTLLQNDDVLGVYEDTLYHLHTTRTPQFLGLEIQTGLWEGHRTQELDQASHDVIIGVLDTGVWPESLSFNDAGLPEIPTRWRGACENAPDFNSSVCNRKLIGARSFSRGFHMASGKGADREIVSPRDSDGHGTHTASTAAGAHVGNASFLGYAAGTARGMAPQARVAAYKVCWKDGCFASDILAGMDRAIQDGVDVLSLSLGGGSAPYFHDTIAIGAFAAVERGIFVSASAGNSGPTRASLANVAPWIMTVGAGTLDRDFPAYATLGNKKRFSGVSLYSGKGMGNKPVSLVYFKGTGSNQSASICMAGSLEPAMVRGKVVVCDRGISARVEKGRVVKEAGGIGMILANTAASGEELVADSHLLPAVAVGRIVGDQIRKYVSSDLNPTAVLSFGGTVLNVRPSPVVAAFSSRGPNMITKEILKPDVIGPGVNILAGWSEAIGEVDGVNVMFKLKGGVGNVGDGEVHHESESLVKGVAPSKRIVYTTTRPSDIRTPYEKMLENQVEFGSPDKRSGGFLNSALIALFYAAALAGLLQRFPMNFSQHTAGQIRNRKSGTSSTKSSERGETVTFADIAGVDEAKEELEEIVEFLRNPDRYTRLGARPPRGVLLAGLPGTGKTLLAKAVAGEADVPFISCSASEFVELYVGMGASRVRDLFARAKREAPSIIFIDEIDAVAKSREAKFRMVSNDEREQTLNQLLTEMDGFDSNSAVIVLGATNRSDVLDPAVRRPGRFDRVVMVEAPDRIGREAILKVHVSKKELPLAKDVGLGDIASMTTGFTGADLANLVNEAALLAGRQSKSVVEKIDFIHAVERSIAGIEKKTAKLQGSEKAVVARHEAGHAVVGTAVAKLLPGQPRVEKLSILPRSGGALGFTYTPPTNEDRYLLFIDELLGRLVTLLGGRAAEEVVYSGRVSTGAFDDIRRATDMAYKAIAEYGLNQTIGPMSMSTLSSGGIDESGGAAPWGKDQGDLVDLVQKEVQTLLQSALAVALSIIRANPTVLEGLGAYLEEKEKVEGEELQKWLKLVVAPTELALFVKSTQAPLLPLQESLLPLQTSL